MKCPVCGKEMVTENFGVNVNVCENGCKGIWFDQGKLAMLDENNEGLGAALEAALRYPGTTMGNGGKSNVPNAASQCTPTNIKGIKKSMLMSATIAEVSFWILESLRTSVITI